MHQKQEMTVIDFDKLVLNPCVHSFGRTITYVYQSGNSIQAYGIFDNVTRLLDPINGLDAGSSGVVATRVMVGVRLSDFPQTPQMGDHIIIEDQKFYIQEVQVDGQGGGHLVLNRAED